MEKQTLLKKIHFSSFNFSPKCCPLWASTKIFPPCRVSQWWLASTASFLDALHASVWHLQKNSTAEPLTVQGMQLLLIFSWGFQPPQRVINLDPAFKIAIPLVLGQRYLQKFPALFISDFPLHCQNIWQVNTWTFVIVYKKWTGWHWYCRRCGRVWKGVCNCYMCL